MTGSLVLLGSFGIFVILGLPIAFCLGVSSLLTAIYVGLPVVAVAHRIALGAQAFPLVAIPLFMLAGALMCEGGIAKRIVNLAYVLVGPVRGSLAMVNCVQSMFFGGVSGSAVADVSSTGPILIPMMVEKGYSREFSTAITVASATQGIIIPPSHNVVIYSMAAGGISVGRLFLAGYIPGIMLGISLMAASYYLARKHDYPREKRPPLRQSLRILWDGLLSMMTAVIIVGGIAFGIFTATEAAGIAVAYALFLAIVVYKEIPIRRLGAVLTKCVTTVASVLFLISCAAAFGWMMTLLQIPRQATDFLLSLTTNRIVLLLLINALVLMLGTIMDVAPLILILTPILLPVMQKLGMDSVQFGLVLMLNLAIGLTTPPVGTALFVGCSVGRTTMEAVFKPMLYLWPAMIAVLLLVTFIPGLTLWLPALLMPK